MAEQTSPQNDSALSAAESEDLTIEELDEVSGGAAGTIFCVSCPVCTFSSVNPN